MRNLSICLAVILLATGSLSADSLNFPTTQAEIVKTLSPDKADKKETSVETAYKFDQNKVYKIIGGKRFRLRGIQVLEAIASLPKAGALINFEFDSASINQNSFGLLDEFGNALKTGLPEARIMIVGHTDSSGPDEYNQKLSMQRAHAVAEYLNSAHAINSSRLIIKGFGESQPIAENNSEQNRHKNRRVEFVRVE